MAVKFVRRPPKESLEWFRAKGMKPGFDHRDVWREEHATAFTVAKATKMDILKDIRSEVDRALAEGRTFRDFAKDLKPTLQKKGWWGEKEMVDPLTGKRRTVQLGSTRRLKIIYETNMRTARSAGQWERIQRTKSGLPYLLYQLGPSREHRPEHVSFHGLLLPVDDSFWATHMTPNGWGCKCHVRQVSKAEHDRLKRNGVRAPAPEQVINPETGLPTGHRVQSSVPVRTEAPALKSREWVNKRTGEVHQVPFGTDPGWNYNPGQTGRLNKSLEFAGDKMAMAGGEASAISKKLVFETLGTWAESPKANFPIAVMSEADAARIGGGTRLVQFSPETLEKQLKRHPELAFEEYTFVQDAIDYGETIQDGARTLVYLLEEEGYVSVVKATKSGKALFMTSFRRLSSDVGKRDREIIRLRKKQK
ncbi:head morphogenesis protein [Pseudodesulfovibrio sp. JC047]|uniref:phage head morphogenesis protein n=1 Tax=Pseudodesulfovibrio sp. JC047 TaxID=2683199 RepID=UPI0013D4A4F5|nr:phage minor head protein [Pseudodesulfovibrio sp. JC047]NDV20872.1 head morphogenesis protein [Pseudodesulfovibrio sp. JC047]